MFGFESSIDGGASYSAFTILQFLLEFRLKMVLPAFPLFDLKPCHLTMIWTCLNLIHLVEANF